MTPLSKNLSTGSECRLASRAIIKGAAICFAAAQHTVAARAVLFRVGKRAAQGHVQRFRSVCTDPIELTIPSGER